MPSKIQLDENLWFLYICLQKSDMKTIDFAAVGLATSLKAPAARMRYTRLKRQIESGSLLPHSNTHHSTSFPSSPSSPSPHPFSQSASFSRSRDTDSQDLKRKRFSGEGEGKEIPEPEARIADGNGKGEKKVKREEGGDCFHGRNSNGSSSSFSSDSDSEDEVPLAKLRKSRGGAHAFGLGEDYNAAGNGGGGVFQTRRGDGHKYTYMPDMRAEDRALLGMIPTGNVGISLPSFSFSGYGGGGWGNGNGYPAHDQGVGGNWEESVQQVQEPSTADKQGNSL